MLKLNVNGKQIELNEEGYLVNSNEWDIDVAKELATMEGKELTDEHFKVLEYLRDRHSKGETLTIRAVGKSGIVDIKGLYKLFPGGPLKLSSKFAGIPKPTSCV